MIKPTFFVQHPDGSFSVANPQPVAMPSVDAMVSRFLGWKLPKDFAPDAGITFKPNANEDSPIEFQYKHEPIGTNLFHAGQVKDMLLYVIDSPMWGKTKESELK
jgi:hypothetical protein